MADPARIVNVRPKPGYVLDGSGAVVPQPRNVFPLRDGLTNAITGMGTSRDARTANRYTLSVMDQYAISAAYSSSGLMRKIIRIPALDMVREWRTWTGAEADEIAKLYEFEKRIGLRQKILQAEVMRGLGGGALVLGLPGNPNEPAPESGELAFVHVVSRWHLSFQQLNTDATSAGYGEPEMWQLTTTTGSQDIHPSRVIPFRADNTATLALTTTGSADHYWGESAVQQVLDAVQDCDAARAGFAALIHKAKLLRIGIPDLISTTATAGGETAVMKRLAILAQAESIHNATIYDAGSAEDGKGGEKIDDAEYTFAGMKDVMNAYGEWAAAISDIPATRLLGRAPEGMNASGDSQQADWNKKVRAMQMLDLAPCLDRLDPHLAAAAKVSSATLAYDFDPLDTPDQEKVAQRFKTQMEAAEKLQMSGAIPDQAFNRGMQSLLIEEGYLPELEAALAEMGNDERFGIEPEDDTDPSSSGKERDPLSAGEGGDDMEADPPRRAANDSKGEADEGAE